MGGGWVRGGEGGGTVKGGGRWYNSIIEFKVGGTVVVGRRCGGMKRGRRDINSPLPHAQVQRCLPRTQVEGAGAALAAVHHRRRLLVAADDCIYTVLDSRVRVQSFVDVSPFFGWFRPRCATPNRAIDLWWSAPSPAGSPGWWVAGLFNPGRGVSGHPSRRLRPVT